MKKYAEPIFYDTTLRDGNQALRRPWNAAEKELIFKRLVKMGMKVIEVGFPASNEAEALSCAQLAKLAPKDVTVSVLARATEADVMCAVQVLRQAAKPRINIFLSFNKIGMKYVLKKEPEEVLEMALAAVRLAKDRLPKNAEIEFSLEHFGDCAENMAFVLNAIEQLLQAGVDVISLPNTVERSYPTAFADMVRQVVTQVNGRAQVSVHCHNDLGMATATTVESFFAGAIQLEGTINGIGERAGNANLLEVAAVLHNSGCPVPLKMAYFFEVAQLVSEMAEIPIYEKAPLMGADSFAHRSGLHQDAVHKTRGLQKNQFVPLNPSLIGRAGAEKLPFTSQSGSVALQDLLSQSGYQFSEKEVHHLLKEAKKKADKKGELSFSDVRHLCF